MNLNKISKHISKIHYNTVKAKQLGYSKPKENIRLNVLFNCLYVMFDNDGYFDSSEVNGIINSIKM